MSSPEFTEHSVGISPEALKETTNQWFSLPVYVALPKEVIAEKKALTDLNGRVKDFAEQHRQDVKVLVEQNRHTEALQIINDRLEEIPLLFEDDEALTARIFTLRRKAYIKEHMATFGEVSKFPLGDRVRTAWFLSAASDYMQADLELGCVSDYALRVSECFGCARLGQLQVLALEKALGGRNFTLIRKGDAAEAVLKDLIRRADETIDLSDQGPVKEAKIIRGQLPDSRAN